MKVLLTATVQSHICQFHKPLVKMLHECGAEVHVAARDNLAEKNGLKLDFVEKIYDLPFSRSPKSIDNIRAYKQLKDILEKERYDVIHCNTPMGGIVTRLAARQVRKRGAKVYYTAHGFHFYKGAAIKNWIVYYPIEKMFSKITDKIITITKEDYKLASKRFKCQVFYIHGVGVNTNKFHRISFEEKQKLRMKYGFKKDQNIILNIGELVKNKNQKTIINAMSEVIKHIPDCKLLIAGNGPERANLEWLIKEKSLDAYVKLLGYTTNIDEYLNLSDVLVTGSFREGLPVNVMEAMLCGKLVIASRNRGHRELIKEGENGYLVDADDAISFAERICYVLQNKRGICQKSIELVAPFTDINVYKELKRLYGIGE